MSQIFFLKCSQPIQKAGTKDWRRSKEGKQQTPSKFLAGAQEGMCNQDTATRNDD